MKTDTTEQLPAVALRFFGYGLSAILIALVGAPFWYRVSYWLLLWGLSMIFIGIIVCLPALIREDRAKRRAQLSQDQAS